MRVAQPILLMNPYEWLPGYGESKILFFSRGADVIIHVEYERHDEDAEKADGAHRFKREFVFQNVRNFLRSPFPDISFFELVGDSEGVRLGELIEFLYSDLVRVSLEAHPPAPDRSSQIRHFSIQFLSANVAFHVLAEEFYLSDEQRCEN